MWHHQDQANIVQHERSHNFDYIVQIGSVWYITVLSCFEMSTILFCLLTFVFLSCVSCSASKASSKVVIFNVRGWNQLTAFAARQLCTSENQHWQKLSESLNLFPFSSFFKQGWSLPIIEMPFAKKTMEIVLFSYCFSWLQVLVYDWHPLITWLLLSFSFSYSW